MANRVALQGLVAALAVAAAAPQAHAQEDARTSCLALALPPEAAVDVPGIDGTYWPDLDGAAALPACRAALAEHPDDPLVLATLGRALLRVGDYAESVEHIRRAADMGNPFGQSLLGYVHFTGWGVPQDPELGVRYYRMAADQGYSYAQVALGWALHGGRGIAQDDQEALRWFRRAAAQGDRSGLARLGQMYDRGWGVPVDLTEAVRLYTLAAHLGDPLAQANLGLTFYTGRGNRQNDAQALHWFRLAADQDWPPGQTGLARLYQIGAGVEQDLPRAIALYRQAAERGFLTAQLYLAEIYDRGNGVPEDDEEALYWYGLAADQGDEWAAERVAELAGATGGTCGDPLAARLESVLADIRDTFELSPPISTCSMLMVADPALRQLLGGADVPIVAELVEDSTGCTEVCREHDTACRDATSLLTAMAEDWQELTELAEARNCEL
ncbi:MAG: sel1 repeat family protein [Rhodospirillaceae bacterium]|nr:sel1 repeat family protein [Rhodospirillaceae bacterium]